MGASQSRATPNEPGSATSSSQTDHQTRSALGFSKRAPCAQVDLGRATFVQPSRNSSSRLQAEEVPDFRLADELDPDAPMVMRTRVALPGSTDICEKVERNTVDTYGWHHQVPVDVGQRRAPLHRGHARPMSRERGRAGGIAAQRKIPPVENWPQNDFIR